MEKTIGKSVLPVAMCVIDEVSQEERGFKPFPTQWTYDPKTQVSTIITMRGTLVLTSFDERDSDTKQDSEDVYTLGLHPLNQKDAVTCLFTK